MRLKCLFLCGDVFVNDDGYYSLETIIESVRHDKNRLNVDDTVLYIQFEVETADIGIVPSAEVRLISEDGLIAFEERFLGEPIPNFEGLTRMSVVLTYPIKDIVLTSYGEYSWRVVLNGSAQEYEARLYFSKRDPT